MLTKQAGTHYDPSATCPLFDEFLHTITAGDDELIEFLWRAIGYSLTGRTSERVVFFFYGIGANGKTVLIETVRTLLGDYARRTPVETFLKTNTGENRGTAGLLGVRFVTASETEAGHRLATALVKEITGGDTISARLLYGEPFEFVPECKIFIGTNHRPTVAADDQAIWDRLRCVPFPVRIPEADRDQHLAEKLLEELPGVLAKAVAACLRWQESGLTMPAAVKGATAEYRTSMDTLADFLGEACVEHADAHATSTALYAAFSEWAKARGERGVTRRSFSQRLAGRGFERRTNGAGLREFRGLGLKAVEQ
jgi:putative DNA primase/helicase